MIFADKENLKTRVAQEILQVREREMDFYTRNLSMLGTHAALLAGFAFTILSQHKFIMPPEGYMSFEMEQELNMWPQPTVLTALERELQTGIGTWPWSTVLQQIFQLFHLMFTAMGILLHLWTVYTTVVTNILGLHLALRGPEGSVDRAVRHMAQQNQFALRKFLWGLVLFNLSLLFFVLTMYPVFVSVFVVACIVTLASVTFVHIKELATIFYLGDDEMITGQWIGLDREQGTNTQGTDTPRKNRRGSCPGSLSSMGAMVSGRYNMDGCALPAQKKKVSLKDGLVAAAERLHLKSANGGKAGSRWSTMVECAGHGSKHEEQAPSRIAERLIFNQQQGAPSTQQSPALRKLTRSNSRRLRWQGASFRLSTADSASSSTRDANVANGDGTNVEAAMLAARRKHAATALQARARGSACRRSSADGGSPGSPYEDGGSNGRANGVHGANGALADGADSADINVLVGGLMSKLGLGQLPPLGWDQPSGQEPASVAAMGGGGTMLSPAQEGMLGLASLAPTTDRRQNSGRVG